ncbi:MAG: acyl-ACP--UDP-N-acetylglucosamine O-acyltransferase [Bacteroidia bacterium]|jgi:UDP-N-acetylglucosamine acyltransferase|nr:acyl-ACP--UDP-N-acetylglucosamine O-acyltransferase [Bacteroidia bacterium]MCF8428043.1 acyl-ACP--UDP-N-acetylglucosamine O-acyltransferase [Bacteroidia bacterium]MCF8447806.1 acyl-ACP--UDP-N-acetylglucosamine O-acyltransferase [Bacteroidia bacterium]
MIQSLSYIHPQAKLAENVVVDPFTTIHHDVEIGEGTWIGSNVTIYPGARIGKNCRIYPGAVISAVPQDLKFDGEETLAIIGDNTTIRECVTINRGTKDKFKTEVGSNCLIMAYTHLAHDCIVGNHVIIANGVQVAGHVVIQDGARIGGLSAIHQFGLVGRNVMIEGGSMVSKDVPPFVKAGRYPITYEGVNSVGLRRSGFSNEKIIEIQDIYRILFVHNRNLSKALDIVEAEMTPTVERDEILAFIRNSERGVLKGFNNGK